MSQASTDAWERFNGLSGSSKGAFVKWLAVRSSHSLASFIARA